MVKQIPNIITVLRIIGAAGLLLFNPTGAAFWVIYGLCGVSDMADGYLARRLQAESKTGAVLDSVADLCFVACCAIRLLPVLQIPTWLWIWAGIIVVIKLINQISALVICKRFCFPHTTANKLTGLLLFFTVPTLFWSIVPIAIVTGIATFAAVQEGHFIRKSYLCNTNYHAMTKKEELEAQGYKTYENEDIQVFWKPRLCQHAGECARGNFNVFNPQRRPWIDLSQAPATEIADIIDRCPSKALQYELLNPISVVFEEELDRAAAYDRGKLIGECEFELSDGKWVIMHTGVREAYEGQGIARKLVLKVVEAARAKGVKILPVCSYAKKLMTGKEEFKDIL